MVNKMEKVILLSTSVGAIFNLLLNFILIPNLSTNGAAIATLIAESLVTLVQLFFSFKFIKNIISLKNFFKYLIGSLLFIPIIILFNLFDYNDIIKLFLLTTLSGIIYFLYLIVIKDIFFLTGLEKFKNFIRLRGQ